MSISRSCKIQRIVVLSIKVEIWKIWAWRNYLNIFSLILTELNLFRFQTPGQLRIAQSLRLPRANQLHFPTAIISPINPVTRKPTLREFPQRWIKSLFLNKKFNSYFESGNLDFVEKVNKEYNLYLRCDSNTRGHTQWYYFS